MTLQVYMPCNLAIAIAMGDQVPSVDAAGNREEAATA